MLVKAVVTKCRQDILSKTSSKQILDFRYIVDLLCQRTLFELALKPKMLIFLLLCPDY